MAIGEPGSTLRSTSAHAYLIRPAILISLYLYSRLYYLLATGPCHRYFIALVVTVA
jgi:hypothetical protein